jgi:hypothetical protein
VTTPPNKLTRRCSPVSCRQTEPSRERAERSKGQNNPSR